MFVNFWEPNLNVVFGNTIRATTIFAQTFMKEVVPPRILSATCNFYAFNTGLEALFWLIKPGLSLSINKIR